MRAAHALVLAALLLGACPEPGGPASDVVGVDAADAADAALDDDGDALDGVGDDAGADTVDGAAGDGFVLTEPGEFVLSTAALSQEAVFKGVWAGVAGRIVAVGNDGVVASRDAAGAWSLLARVEGAALLNAVHGVDAEHLWAVGMNGTVLPGTATSFGESAACTSAADCEDDDPCTLDLCSAAGACVVEPSGFAGCCGAPVGQFDFESGMLSPWVVEEASGGLVWQLSNRRAASGTWALYFGDPAKDPPDYDTGVPVTATAVSPPITLPVSGTATLRFSVFLESEPETSFDALEVYVSSGATRVKVWDKADLAPIPTGTFLPAEVDLTSWRGQTISLRVRFDSVDASLNLYEGAYLDDIVIDTACAPVGTANTQTGPTLWGVYAVARDAAWAVGRAGAIRQWDGARWGDAQGNDPSVVWNGLTGFGDALALVGNGGVVNVLGGSGLVAVDAGTTWNLHSVSTADGEVFWAVGDQGTLLRGDGLVWQALPSPTGVSLRDVHAASNGDVWAVGYQGAVYHWDGGDWTRVDFIAEVDLSAVWAAGDGLVTVTGSDGRIFQGGLGGFVEVGAFHTGGELLDLWGVGHDLYAVGSGGRAVAYREGSWSVQVSGTSQALEAVYGVTGADVWAVGRSGTIVHWDGAVWARVESSTTAALNAVWGPDSEHVYAAGSGGALVAWDGLAWTTLVSSTSENLRAVFGRVPNDVWAVGAAGVIMHYNGLGWARSPVEKIATDAGDEEITDELHAVWAAAHDDAWAVGAEGRILRWDGHLWKRVETEFGVTLRGIYGLAGNDVFAVGNAGHVIHFNGADWQVIPSGSVATLHAIHGDGARQVVAVGALGTVLTLKRD